MHARAARCGLIVAGRDDQRRRRRGGGRVEHDIRQPRHGCRQRIRAGRRAQCPAAERREAVGVGHGRRAGDASAAGDAAKRDGHARHGIVHRIGDARAHRQRHRHHVPTLAVCASPVAIARLVSAPAAMAREKNNTAIHENNFSIANFLSAGMNASFVLRVSNPKRNTMSAFGRPMGLRNSTAKYAIAFRWQMAFIPATNSASFQWRFRASPG